MINNIGLYQNIQIPQRLAFRAKQESTPVTSPIENSNLSGVDALASYNSAFVKANDKFNIPLLEMVQLPPDINSIDGERIYNSKGILECVAKELGDKKYVYLNNSDGMVNLIIYDKNTGNKIFEQCGYIDNYDNKTNTGYWVNKYDAITGEETSSTRYENGKPTMKESYIRKPDGSNETRLYLYNKGEYTIYGNNAENNMHYEESYDINKNLIYSSYREINDDGISNRNIKYNNGKKISDETTESKAVENPEYQKYLKNPEVQAAKCPEYITTIDNIEGEKTYYSDGSIESVKTADGKLYESSFDGQYITLHDGNTKIEFSGCKDDFAGNKHCTIIEDFGDAKRTTNYSGKNGNELWGVTYNKGNIEKWISYENGKPSYYRESDTSKEDWSESEFFSVEYAPNGGVLNYNEGNCKSLD